MRILLLVITGFEDSFRKIDDMRREQCKKFNIPVLFLYNGVAPEGFQFREDERVLAEPKHIPGQFIKFHIACKEIVETYGENYDYLIRCTSAGFVDFNKLHILLSYLPKQRCHAGRFCWNDYGVYMSGPCMIFSSDVIKKFAEMPAYHQRVFEHSDDVMISQAVREFAEFSDINFYWTDLHGRTEMPTHETVGKLRPWDIIFRVKNYGAKSEGKEFTKEMGFAIDVRFWEILRDLTGC